MDGDVNKSFVVTLNTPPGMSCVHAVEASVSKRGPFTCPCEPGLVTHWMLWSLGKASGGDSVKDKWPGPASSTELEGNPSCSAMNQRVPSGREAVCLLHSPCHRSKPYRHQASPRRQPKQQFPIYLQPVEPWKLQSTSTHKVQGS